MKDSDFARIERDHEARTMTPRSYFGYPQVKSVAEIGLEQAHDALIEIRDYLQEGADMVEDMANVPDMLAHSKALGLAQAKITVAISLADCAAAHAKTDIDCD